MAKFRFFSIIISIALFMSCAEKQDDPYGFDTPAGSLPGKLSVNYPRNGTIFPPEMASPLIAWSDSSGAVRWELQIITADNSKIYETVSDTEAFHPARQDWENIKSRLKDKKARLFVLGYPSADQNKSTSGAAVEFSISADSVGAPVFFRTVPLPFSFAVAHQEMIQWRLGDISDDSPPPVVLKELPVCGNCHTFTPDGRKIGMDIDYGNDKGSYFISDVKKDITISDKGIITWSDYKKEDGEKTFGLLSQLSPDGNFAVSTVKDRSIFVPVDNLEYSQLFFPIKGIIAYYDIANKKFGALNGADDPDFVQSNPVFSPDGETIVFAKAPVYHSKAAEGSKKNVLPTSAAREFLSGEKNFRYDLYYVPFNKGKGGKSLPVRGASHNGSSNYFPKYSPDGKWIVFCRADNFMLLQRDSKLFIMPAEDIYNKEANPREMNCNTANMNSWHSWSPNSRWLVFASKAYDIHTGLFITHIDENGNDSPPVFLDNLSVPGMAANIPEFANIGQGGIRSMHPEFMGSDRYFALRGALRSNRGDFGGAITEYNKAISNNPKDPENYHNLALVYLKVKSFDKALENLNKAIKFGSGDSDVFYLKGFIFNEIKKYKEAAEIFDALIKKDPEYVLAYYEKGVTMYKQERFSEALPLFDKTIELSPKGAMAYYMKGITKIQLGREDYCKDFEESRRLGFQGADEAINEYCK